jgi:restriction endonuclease S subunit
MAGDSKEVARAHLADAGVEVLPHDWDVVTLGDLFTEDRGIAVGVMYPGDHDPDGVPLIKAGDLNGSIINPQPDFRISRDKHHEYRRTALEGGELLMTLVGNVGQCAVVPPRMAGWNTARAVAVMRLADSSETHFVQQCLLSRPLQHLMDVWCNTTVQATLNLKEIRQLPLPWPPKKSRDAIAAIGKALDDKIELNRRMNATLEAMARALFQSWFVDFDPVRAKLDGRLPAALDPATAALFPDSFHDSPLGLIPYGWEVKTIADVTFRVTKGDTPRSEAISACPQNDRLIPMLRVNAITEDGEVLLDKAEMIPESIHLGKSKRSILEENDILYTNAGTIGRVALVQKDFLPANTNQAMAIIRPDPARVPPAFLYMIMRQPEFQTLLHHDIVQAVQANLALGKISAAQAVFPPMETLTRLTAPLVALLNKVFENRTQSRTLATLRDTLLPKLLSGELSVTTASEQLEKMRPSERG